jgi:hypothetical protein
VSDRAGSIDPSRVVIKQVLRSGDDSNALIVRFCTDGTVELYAGVANMPDLVRGLAQFTRLLVEYPGIRDALSEQALADGYMPPRLRNIVVDPPPSGCGAPCDVVVLHFPDDVQVRASSCTRDPDRLAGRLACLLESLNAYPEELRRIAGVDA